MYNNLTKDDILEISDKIKIGNHYRNKLHKIKDEKKLKLEFSKILTKYDKFIKLKKQIHKLANKKNKLRKYKTQKGGQSFFEIKNKIQSILNSESFNLENKSTYLDKLTDIQDNINKLPTKHLMDKIRMLEDELEKIKQEKDRKLLDNLAPSEMTNEVIVQLQKDKKRLEDEIKREKSTNLELINNINIESSKKDEDLTKKYNQQIINLQKLNDELKLKIDTCNAEKNSNENKQTQCVEQLTSQTTLNNQEKAKLLAQIDLLNTRNIELQHQFKDINACKEEVARKQAEILNLKIIDKSKSDNLEKCLGEKEQIQSVITELQQQLNKKEVEIENLNGISGKLTNEKEKLNEELTEIQNKLQNTNKLSEEFSQLRQQNKDLLNQIRTLEQQERQVDRKLEEDVQDIADIKGNLNDKEMDKRENEILQEELVEEEEAKEDLENQLDTTNPFIDTSPSPSPSSTNPFEDPDPDIEIEPISQKPNYNRLGSEELLNDEPEPEPEPETQKPDYQRLDTTDSELPLEEEDILLQMNTEELLDESDELRQNDEPQWLLNKINNTQKKSNYISDKKNKEAASEYLEEETEKLKGMSNNLLTSKFPSLIGSILGYFGMTTYDKLIEDDPTIRKDNFKDLDYIQLGGSRNLKKRFKLKQYGGAKPYHNLLGELNSIGNDIHNYTNNYKFLLQLNKDFKNHATQYEKSLLIQPNKMLKRISKGVIMLYLRLLNDIMEKWESFKWIKNESVLNQIDLEGVKHGDRTDIQNMIKTITSLNLKYKNPDFSIENDISPEIKQKLKEFWDNYFFMIIKWSRILFSLSKKVRGDEVLLINDKIKQIFNEFNILKEKLDDYQLLIRKPVSVYARINDIGRDDKEGFEKTKKLCSLSKNDFRCNRVKSDDYVMFSIYPKKDLSDPNLLKIAVDKCDNIQEFKDMDKVKFNKYQEIANINNSTEFDEIFFTTEFSNNKTISRYMLLDKLLGQGIGVFLVTYGYSGVGKSFTLFGNDKNPGLLQSTINNITNIVNTKLRIYEVYGLGLPYSDGYKDLNNMSQEIVHYNLNISNATKKIIVKSNPTRTFKNINEYINKINDIKGDSKLRSDDKLFLQLPKKKQDLETSLNSIADLISQIDTVRKTATIPRVKPTINNPDSSRSVLIYDFIFDIKLENGDIVETAFCIDDMPGLEDPIKTYITENKKKLIYDGPNTITQDVRNYMQKNKFTKELQYFTHPMKNYQELLLMSCLINPLYVSILQPNDIFSNFNKQETEFKKQVFNNFQALAISVQNNNIKLDQDNKLVLHESKNKKKDLRFLALDLLENIIQVCIDNQNYNPLIDILTDILIKSQIPSNPALNILKIKLDKNDINKIKKKFQKKLLVPLIIEFLQSPQASGGRNSISVDAREMQRYELDHKKQKPKQRVLLENRLLSSNQKLFRKGWETLSSFSRDKKKWPKNFDGLIDFMLKKSMSGGIKNKIDSKISKGMEKASYYDYIESMIKNDKNTNMAFEIVSNIALYEKKQNTTYADPKMDKVVKSFIQVAYEAWYINQNIAGILKYYSNISEIQPEIIDRYIPKQNIEETMMSKNVENVKRHITNIYENGEDNLGLHYQNIFNEIKHNTHSTKLFQTPEQESQNDLIVRNVINPYAEEKIQDFKMFYVLSNNNTQLKCLNQLELLSNTKEFIERIGKI